MLTFFCLMVFCAWPHELGIPWWALVLSMMLDLVLGFICDLEEIHNVHL